MVENENPDCVQVAQKENRKFYMIYYDIQTLFYVVKILAIWVALVYHIKRLQRLCVDAGGCHRICGFFRRVCPIFEPGDKILNAKGVWPYIRSTGRNFVINALGYIREKLHGGLPVFIMEKCETPGTMFNKLFTAA